MEKQLRHTEAELFYEVQVRDLFYNPEQQLFSLGNTQDMRQFNLAEVQDIWDMDRETLSLAQDVVSPKEHILGINARGVIVFPRLRRWVVEKPDSEQRQMAEVIQDAMHAVRKTSRNRHATEHATTFHADGSFRLQTPGICACLGPVGLSRSNPFSLPQEYSFHNADTPTQRLSLLAGAGTIAWLIRQEA